MVKIKKTMETKMEIKRTRMRMVMTMILMTMAITTRMIETIR